MVDEAKIQITLDDAQLKKQFTREERVREQKDRREVQTRRIDPRLVERLRESLRQRRGAAVVTPSERAEVTAAAGPTALEALAGGRVGVGAFLVSRSQELGKRLFFPGIGIKGEPGQKAAARFQRFTQTATRLTAQAAAVEKTVTVGLPVLSTFIEGGIKDAAGDDPVSQAVAETVSQAMKEITDAVQQAKAEISGTIKTIREATTVSKGFALTGQDFGKLPNLLATLRGVNVRQSKIEQDMNESVLREGTSAVGKFVKDSMADLVGKMFDGDSQR